MKAKDWKFEKLIPDEEDCKAACNTFSEFNKLPDVGMNSVDYFHSGFMRGLAWAKAKYNIKD